MRTSQPAPSLLVIALLACGVLLTCCRGEVLGGGAMPVSGYTFVYGACGGQWSFIVVTDIPGLSLNRGESSGVDCTSSEVLQTPSGFKLAVDFDGRDSISVNGEEFSRRQGALLYVSEGEAGLVIHQLNPDLPVPDFEAAKQLRAVGEVLLERYEFVSGSGK